MARAWIFLQKVSGEVRSFGSVDLDLTTALHIFLPKEDLYDRGIAGKSSKMAYKADIRTTFEPTRTIEPLYTGGSVALSQDGRILASCLGEDVLISDLSTGEHLARIEGVSFFCWGNTGLALTY